MGKRILTWHLDQIRGDLESQGPIYYADYDYSPDAIRLAARRAPDGGDLKVDIRADGVSILTSNYAALNKGATLEEHAEDYPATQVPILEGQVITLHVIKSGGAVDITCSLEMDTLSDGDTEQSA